MIVIRIANARDPIHGGRPLDCPRHLRLAERQYQSEFVRNLVEQRVRRVQATRRVVIDAAESGVVERVHEIWRRVTQGGHQRPSLWERLVPGERMTSVNLPLIENRSARLQQVAAELLKLCTSDGHRRVIPDPRHPWNRSSSEAPKGVKRSSTP